MKGDESDVESRTPGGDDDAGQKPQEPVTPREPSPFRVGAAETSSLSDHPPAQEPRPSSESKPHEAGEGHEPLARSSEESVTGEAPAGEEAPAKDERRRGDGRRDGFRVRGGRDSNRQGRRDGGRDSGRGRGRAQEPQDDDADEEESFTHEGAESIEQDDPLAGAFDLERGTPINPLDGYQERDNLPVRAKVKSAKEFFSTEILYRFDILEDDDRSELRGSYRLELKGYQGGVWTVNLGDGLEVVNRREDAEIVLTMQQRDFVTLVNGQLNPQLAIFAQKMRVSGDVKKAILFQNLLCPTTD